MPAGVPGSSRVDEATSAIDSSGAIATLCGGPTTELGARTSPMVLGGDTERSMIVTVSGGGFGTTVVTPSTSVAFESFADTTSCASPTPAVSGQRTTAIPIVRNTCIVRSPD